MPWGAVAANQQQFIHDQHLPFGFKLHKDPSKMNKAEVSGLLKYWYKRQLNPTVPVPFRFQSFKHRSTGDITACSDNPSENGKVGTSRRRRQVQKKGKGKQKEVIQNPSDSDSSSEPDDPKGDKSQRVPKAKGKQHLADSDSKSNSDSHPHRSRAGLEVRKQRGNQSPSDSDPKESDSESDSDPPLDAHDQHHQVSKVSDRPAGDPSVMKQGRGKTPLHSGSSPVAPKDRRKVVKSKAFPVKDAIPLADPPQVATEVTAALRRRVRLDAARKVAMNAASARQKDGPPVVVPDARQEKPTRRDAPVTWSKRKAGSTEPIGSDPPSTKRMKTRSHRTVGDCLRGPDSKGTKGTKALK